MFEHFLGRFRRLSKSENLSQPVPAITQEDVERVVHRDFAAEQFSAVMILLGEYGSEKWHREPDRVRLAALKLSGGTLEGLRRAIDTAKQDYRDVLAAAEYPGYSKAGFGPQMSAKLKQVLYAEDWQQYENWLRK